MKKVLFTLIAAIAFCGSIYAQPESHWPDFDDHAHEQQGALVASVSIDDNLIMPSYDNYFEDGGFYIINYEVAAFVDGECRGVSFLNYYEGDAYVTTNMMAIHYDPDIDNGVEVTFQLFDHANQVEYTYCISSQPVLTGRDYIDYDNPVRLSFFHTFTKEIVPYTSGEGENNGWYFITSPLNAEVSPENVLNMLSNNYDLYYFDQNGDTEGNEWINYEGPDGNFSLVAGKGYLYANSGNGSSEPITLTFIGAPYNGDGTFELEYDDVTNQDPSMHGWNLVGNPFNQPASIDKAYYRMNPDNGSEVITGVGNIGAMEGVFVQATAPGQSVNFSTAPSNGKGQIVLDVTQNHSSNVIDRAIVRFGQGDMLPKFMLNESNTKMYISKDDNDYAVVRSNKSGKLPVYFEPSKDGVYTISVNTENVYVRSLHLIDNKESIDIDLLQTPSYEFVATQDDGNKRFLLVFETGFKTFKDLRAVNDGKSFGFCNNGEWTINNEGDALLQVIDVNGQILINEEINGSVSKHINAAPGVYILRLVNGKDEKVQKIVVE